MINFCEKELIWKNTILQSMKQTIPYSWRMQSKAKNANTDQVRKFKIFITLIFPQAFDPRLQWLAIFFDR